MPLNSVNTNVGAAVAMRHFADARVQRETVERRLATGFRVGSVRDDGAIWSIAQIQRGDIKAADAVLTSLQRGRSIVDVAMAAGEAISELLLQMRDKALAASDEGMDQSARQSLNTDFQALRDQIAKVVRNASFNGVNLIENASVTIEVLAGLQVTAQTTQVQNGGGNGNGGNGNGNGGNGNGNGNGGNGGGNGNGNGNGNGGAQSVTSHRPERIALTAAGLGLAGPNVLIATSASIATAADGRTAAAQVKDSIENVSAVLTRLGAVAKRLQLQHVFIGKLQDSLRSGVGDLVDADLGKEAARLQSIQVKQQLGVQAMSIANRAPEVLTQLFRN